VEDLDALVAGDVQVDDLEERCLGGSGDVHAPKSREQGGLALWG
jgi:hypothetical protein